MSCFYIIAMRMESRVQNALHLQKTLTKFGCNIKTRLGMHEAGGDYCANDGLIILQACGKKEEIDDMVKTLNGIDGVIAKMIDLNE